MIVLPVIVNQERGGDCDRRTVGILADNTFVIVQGSTHSVRAGDPADAERPVGAGYVFDDDGLAERAPHAFGDDARDHVLWSARASWHYDRDRPRWVGLRVSDLRGHRESGGTGYKLKKLNARERSRSRWRRAKHRAVEPKKSARNSQTK